MAPPSQMQIQLCSPRKGPEFFPVEAAGVASAFPSGPSLRT